MNFENSKTYDPHRLRLLRTKSDEKLKKLEWKIWITWWIIFCIRYSRLFWKYLKKSWNVTIRIPSIIPSIRISINNIEIRINTGYYFDIMSILSQMPETIKLLGSTASKITKDENGENVPHLEVTEVVLIHCNIVNNDYQQDSRVLYTFVPNNSCGQLLDISPKTCIFLKDFNSEFPYIEVSFTDQNSKPL